jgi:hypothetical protein
METTFEINYIAVLVSGVAYFLLGGLWYSPVLFAKTWLAAIGKTEEQIKQSGAAAAYIISFIGSLAAALVLAMFVDYAGADSLPAGLVTGFFIWFGFVATTVAPPYFYEDRNKRLYLIYSGYTLVGFLMMASILALWR